MPTSQKILDAAKKEFLQNGYKNASMRAIANQVGVSATALYRHFKDKETLFGELVDPVLRRFLSSHKEHDREAYEMLEKGEPSAIWTFSAEEFINSIHYVYDHFDVFKLLTCCSAGTKYSGFLHELVEQEVQELLYMHQIAKSRGIVGNELDAQDLHLIMTGFFSSLFELIIHNYSREEAVKRCKVLSLFFHSGLSAVIGF